MWKRFTKNKDETTDDPIEATLVGLRNVDPCRGSSGHDGFDAVRQAMHGSGGSAKPFRGVYEHQPSPIEAGLIGKIDTTGDSKSFGNQPSP
jgi:hypothetical protein